MISAAVSAMQGVVDTVGGIGQAIADLINSITDLPIVFMEGIVNMFKAIPRMIRNLIPNIMKMVMGIITGFVDMIADLPDAIFDMIDNIVDVLINGIIGKIPELMGKLLRGFLRIALVLVPKSIKMIIQAIPQVIKAFVEMVPLLIDELINGIKSALNELANVFGLGDIFNLPDHGEFVEKAQAAMTEVSEQLFSVLDFQAARGSFEKVREAEERLKDILNGWLQKLKAMWMKLLRFFQGVWDKLVETWRALWKFIEGLWKSLVNLLAQVWEVVKDIFDFFIKAVGKAIKFVGDVLGKAIQFLADVWDAGVKFFKSMWDAAVGLLKSVWEVIKKAWDGIINGLSQIWDFAVNGLKQIFEFARGVFNKYIEGVKAIFAWVKEKIFDPIVDAFKKVLEPIQKAFSSIVDTVQGAFDGLSFDKIKDSFQGLFNGLDFKKLTGQFTKMFKKFNPVNLLSKMFKFESGGKGTVEKLLGINVPFVSFSRGGDVPGEAIVPGDSPLNDKVLSLLSPGEFVLPRSVMNQPGVKGFIDMLMNNGSLPQFKIGGTLGKIIEGGQNLGKSIVGAGTQAGKVLGGGLSSVLGEGSKILKRVTTPPEGVRKGLASARDAIQDIADKAGKEFGKVLDQFQKFFDKIKGNTIGGLSKGIAQTRKRDGLGGETNAFTAVGEAMRMVAQNMKMKGKMEQFLESEAFASGGLVRGTGTDGVPARLTPGEFVINRSAANQIGLNNLNAMNSGRMGPNVTNVDVKVVINNQGDSNLTDSFIRQRMMPTIKSELKRASVKGDFLISSKGVR